MLVWTPSTNTITSENGCAVLEASAGGHIAGFTTANMAHYWTQEVERFSACTAATETVHRANIDEIQTDTATAPVDPSLAAPRAAIASPSPPVSVIEHATLAPVTCTQNQLQ